MTKPGMSLALRLLADDLDATRAYLNDRYDYCVEKGENKEGKLWTQIVRVQDELMRLAREAESPVDPIPSAASTPREAPPEVVASPSRAAGPLRCACGTYPKPTRLHCVDGRIEDHRIESCVTRRGVMGVQR